MSDPVTSPAHYTQGGIEAIDAMEAQSTPEQFAGYLRLNAVKYLWRCGSKDDALQDARKAEWYVARLIKALS